MRLWIFVPKDEVVDIQVKLKERYTDANALQDTNLLDKNLSSVLEENDEEPDEMTNMNRGIETPQFSDVYAAVVVDRRKSIKRDTPVGRQRQALTRTQ